MYKKFRMKKELDGAHYAIRFESSKTKSGDGSVLLGNPVITAFTYGSNSALPKTKDVSIKKFAKKLTSAIASYSADKQIDETLARPVAPTMRGVPMRRRPTIQQSAEELVISSVVAKKNALLLEPHEGQSPIPQSLLKAGKFVVKVGAPAGLTPAAAELGFLVDGRFDYAVQGLPNEVATITSVKNSAGKTLHKLVKVSAPVVFNATSPTYTTSVFSVFREFTSTDSRSDDAFTGGWELDMIKSLLTCSTKGFDSLQKKYVEVKTEIAKKPNGYKIDSYSNNIKIQSATLTLLPIPADA